MRYSRRTVIPRNQSLSRKKPDKQKQLISDLRLMQQVRHDGGRPRRRRRDRRRGRRRGPAGGHAPDGRGHGTGQGPQLHGEEVLGRRLPLLLALLRSLTSGRGSEIELRYYFN
jgi:hypothetical protein